MWLVTGATGQIGNFLVRKPIGRGEKVRALVLPCECRVPIKVWISKPSRVKCLTRIHYSGHARDQTKWFLDQRNWTRWFRCGPFQLRLPAKLMEKTMRRQK
jgi:hypothetical protein